MGKFSSSTKGRSWMVTVQIANMEKAGLPKEEYEKPEKLANFFCDLWEESGKGRTAGASVCVSLKGVYHMHMALYGNLTTLKKVSEIMCLSHVEPVLGRKQELKNYLLKNPPYDEKGEQVFYTQGLDNIQDSKGRRSDLEEIEDMLEKGYTPAQIMEESFSFRKYEKMIKAAFIDRRIKETPLLKENKKAIWIVGESGTGKSYYYYQLCEKYGEENIYLATDHENGGLDFYIERGAPRILFLDEFRGANIKYAQLLVILDKYSRAQIHCRYSNCYCLWSTVVITSIFPPDEVYLSLVDKEKRDRDKIDQLIRRLDIIEYRYKQNGEYKAFSIPASEYTNYDDLKQRALEDENGFIPADEAEDNPFA